MGACRNGPWRIEGVRVRGGFTEALPAFDVPAGIGSALQGHQHRDIEGVPPIGRNNLSKNSQINPRAVSSFLR